LSWYFPDPRAYKDGWVDRPVTLTEL